jgi:hypothetical protein
VILCSLHAPNRTGLLSVRPSWTLRYKQLSQLGAWRGLHIVPNGWCDPAMVQTVPFKELSSSAACYFSFRHCGAPVQNQ